MEPEVFPGVDHVWSAAQARREVAVTLVSEQLFARVAPALATAVAVEMIRTGAWDHAVRACAVSDLALRITSFAVRLEPGEVSSSRYDWHVDRIGAIEGQGPHERWDAADYTRTPSFVSYSDFVADRSQGRSGASAGTEFVQGVRLSLADRWHTTEQVQAAIDRTLAAGFATARPMNREPAAFTARHIHRPGIAVDPGWRLFIRAGAYKPGCSPYQDHLPTAIPVTREAAPRFWLRPLGTMSSIPPRGGTWSVPVPASKDALDRFLASHALSHSPEQGRLFLAALDDRRRAIGRKSI